MTQALSRVLAALGWSVPLWLVTVVFDLVSGVVWLVGEIGKLEGLKGQEKLALALELARAFADDYLDAVPRWAALPEDRRDRVLAGVVEVALAIGELATEAEQDGASSLAGPDSRDARRARRATMRKLKGSDVAKLAKSKAKRKPKARVKTSSK